MRTAGAAGGSHCAANAGEAVSRTQSQSGEPGVAEFKRVTVWDVRRLPPLEERAGKPAR
jgi:hypothetical protein